MLLAERLAQSVARAYGRDPWQIANAIDLPVYRERLPGSHRELYIEEHRPFGLRALVIAAEADAREARELLAHGLAHAFLHVGDRLTGRSRAIWSGRHEREADDFAACLLIDPEALEAAARRLDEPSRWELSEQFDVSEALIDRRLHLFQGAPRLPA
jgi:Zn-dependent peptidase ImmA (M78 family)